MFSFYVSYFLIDKFSHRLNRQLWLLKDYDNNDIFIFENAEKR